MHYQTARNDFVDLLEGGYFVARRVGEASGYFPAESGWRPELNPTTAFVQLPTDGSKPARDVGQLDLHDMPTDSSLT